MISHIKENILYLRQLTGESQEIFGQRFGLTRDNIASYERGSEPKLEAIVKIVNYFHITIDLFVNTNLAESKSKEYLTSYLEENKTKSKDILTMEKGKENGKTIKKYEKYNNTYSFGIREVPLEENPDVQEFKLKTDSITDIQQIPLYDMEAVAGLVPLFNDTIKHVPIDYIQIPNLPRCDGAIYITGDSMYPLLKSGDIVLYKRVDDILNCIFWGEMYLISVDMGGEEYVTVKYIQKSDQPDYIRLVSYNQHHDDKDVPVSKIRALAFIKASIRINSMK